MQTLTTNNCINLLNFLVDLSTKTRSYNNLIKNFQLLLLYLYIFIDKREVHSLYMYIILPFKIVVSQLGRFRRKPSVSEAERFG